MPNTFSAPAASSDMIRLCAPVTAPVTDSCSLISGLPSCFGPRVSHQQKTPAARWAKRDDARAGGWLLARASLRYEYVEVVLHGSTVPFSGRSRQAGWPQSQMVGRPSGGPERAGTGGSTLPYRGPAPKTSDHGQADAGRTGVRLRARD